jgi:hypothetical protein
MGEPRRFDTALAAKLAGMLENDGTVTFVMLVEHNARMRPARSFANVRLRCSIGSRRRS